ncbi:xanthine dehydrogenase family protein molybdopterin-binding subunit [Roseomonas nepalensis]|uniref:Xanthine dehydrogenase family protein molybdopterin-binding subunit n=1 Tax=Muricoccus nepalensis TaxID=1854500 RepID=A0A502FSH2_9PROT|nr:xanthine dehydrogenase family protein molybdopterin-binding subunit [Roseomonas nepalensis]TPG52415.1 xanthine dehydrogenase family protein molybdopterin-binding subunit [Roseomonas nepalensis]
MGHWGSGRRVEDEALLRGLGRYSDDETTEGAAAAIFLRSPHAHALIRGIDAAAARALPGVRAVLTGADLAGLGSVTSPMPVRGRDGAPIRPVHRPALAAERVRHLGEPVALVVAETVAGAQDAAEAVVVDYDPLPAVTDPAAALAPGAPALWPEEAPGNLALDWAGPPDPDGTKAAAVEAAFARAALVARVSVPIGRLVVASLEPRAATASFDPGTGRYTLLAGSQGAAGLRQGVAASMGIPEDALRVVSHDVGGAFGMKSGNYPEYPALLRAAERLGRPVRWVSTRSEAFLTDNQGRGSDWTAELALDEEGRFLALRVEGLADLGAYLTQAAAFVPTGLVMMCLPAMYDIPHVAIRTRCAFTNTVPTGPYRGAGRPEINLLLERAVEEAARVRGEDGAALRRRNLIPPARMPYATAVGTTYDSGDFPAVLEAALRAADHAGFPARRAEAEARGRLRGIGLACFLENAGVMPDEPARIAFAPDGTVSVSINAVSSGQGHETVFGDLAAERLGVPRAAVRVTRGDSDRDVPGFGAVASRSAMTAGGAIAVTADEVLRKARPVAALLLQAQEEEVVVFEGGRFTAGGAGAVGLIEVAARAAELGTPLDTTAKVTAPTTFPNGCHVAEVEIDPETGATKVVSYVAVDDCGRVLNAMVVEGQIMGGVAQGLGQALTERVAMEADGQLVSGSFMDYALPRAEDVPEIQGRHIEVPATTNPLGVKGTGEAGTTAAPPAILGAIANALPPGAASRLVLPATAERVWRALQEKPA